MTRLTGNLLTLSLLLATITPAVSSEDAKPLILLYHGPTSVYGQAVSDMIEADGRFDEARILLTDDRDLMNTILYMPQVKSVVLLITQFDFDVGVMEPALRWYFKQGGGIVGIGRAGAGDAALSLTEDVFPIFGNWLQRGEYQVRTLPNDTRRISTSVTYERDEIIPEINGESPEEFVLKDKRFVTSVDTLGDYLERKPDAGEYNVLFRDSEMGAPLVVVYHQNGTSVTFAGTDQVSEQPGDTYFGNILDDPNFSRLLMNAVYYVWSQERRYEAALVTSSEALAEIQRRERDKEQASGDLLSGERSRRAAILLLLVLGGVGGIGAVAYYSLLSPRRERSAQTEQGNTD